MEPGYLSGIALGYGLDDRWFESRLHNLDWRDEIEEGEIGWTYSICVGK
jgi:hypothetical protein